MNLYIYFCFLFIYVFISIYHIYLYGIKGILLCSDNMDEQNDNVYFKLVMTREKRDKVKEYAKIKKGMTMQGFINRCIDKCIEKDLL